MRAGCVRGQRSARRASLGITACLILVLVLALLAACAPSTSQKATRASTPTPAATVAVATPDAASLAQRRLRAQMAAANAVMRRMTLDQELGQLFIVEYLYTDPNHSDLQEMIGRLNAGGVILYHALNIVSVA